MELSLMLQHEAPTNYDTTRMKNQ
uniref:Uncharacterized protein n=1 Tax=Rhizophora mucronata TaxID=61149 RepID=A0A2P2NEA9_RHIMU